MNKPESDSVQKQEEYHSEFNNFKEISATLYQSYRQYQRSNNNDTCNHFTKLMKKIPNYFEVIWNEIFPINCWKSQSSRTIESLRHLHENPHIYVGNLSCGLKLIEEQNNMFFVLLYKQLDIEEGDLKKIVKQFRKTFCIVASMKEKCIKDKLDISDNQRKFPLLLVCRKNIAQKIVIFNEIELDIDVDSFKLINEGMKELVQDYEIIENQVIKKYERDEVESKEMLSISE